MTEQKRKMLLEEAVEESISLLFAQSYERLGNLSCTAFVTGEPEPFERRECGTKMQLQEGDVWAKEVFDCAWFHITGELPAGCSVKSDAGELVFLINCGGEGLVYDRNGVEKQSITCFASDFSPQLGSPEKKVVYGNGLIVDGKVDFWIDAAANDLFGKSKDSSRMALLFVARQHMEIRALAYDVQTLFGVYMENDDGEWETEIINAIGAMQPAWENLSDAAAKEMRVTLAPFLAAKNEGDMFQYSAVGHAHLDLAWLWPIRESKRKTARTCATQLMNIERYPGYIFGASQAQLYTWVKEEMPRLWERIRVQYEKGNWDLQGATWVEMDSNLISGESMIRQFYYGKQFYLNEFGEEMKILWLPDSFGYSACLPQVMKLADVPYFLTQKMSWNTVNKFPYHSFYWQGLDGSQVLAHMLPDDTYNSPIRADFLKFGEQNYQERAISDKAMLLFGIGDGGAGPGFEHLERLRRFENLKNIPKVRPEKSLSFFKRFDDGKTPYPTHAGELYLEKHQGTYTTQSKNKRYNRKCEFALRNYELLAFFAQENALPLPISPEMLDEMWKEVLLYQFHDILPGSSINRVYEESVARYELLLAQLENGIQTLSDALANGKGYRNLNAFSYTKALRFESGWFRCNIPALGLATMQDGQEISEFAVKAQENQIENDCLRVTFADGCITSLFDKRLGKEFVADGGKMALVSQYTDTGDCWDIAPIQYEESKRDAVCTAFTVGTDGAVAFAQGSYTLGETSFTQHFTLTDGSALLECDLCVDCHQQDAMLRIAFPTGLETEEANFNIPFGHLARKTTNNNSVEKAQYEVSGQKFVDLSQTDCGLSLLNDCKYGYKCKNGVIDMDLIRSPKDGPGENVDQGAHSIRYALLPHAGALGMETYREAYLLNNPLLPSEGTAAAALPAFDAQNSSIVLESVKIPQDGNGLLVRLYNANAAQCGAKVTLEGYRMTEAVGVMENTLANLEGNNLTLNGFELKIIRFIKN